LSLSLNSRFDFFSLVSAAALIRLDWALSMFAEAEPPSSGFGTDMPGDVDDYISNLERTQANFTGKRSHRKAERSDDLIHAYFNQWIE
ncbi:unnamed protein product, partial [Prunus brigantina]